MRFCFRLFAGSCPTCFYSHSIILSNRNALNCKRKLFLHTTKNRLFDPSENCALEFANEFPGFRPRSVSATIDTDRSIFDVRCRELLSARPWKNTVITPSSRPAGLPHYSAVEGHRLCPRSGVGKAWLATRPDVSKAHEPAGTAGVRYRPDLLLMERSTRRIVRIIHGAFY